MIEDIINQLAKLSGPELLRVEQAAAGLRGALGHTVGNSNSSEELHVELLSDALAEVLRSETGASTPPLSVLRRNCQHMGAVRSAAFKINEFLRKYLPEQATLVERRSQFMKFVQLAVLNLKRAQGAPITHKTLTHALAEPAALLDIFFPGYVASGMVHLAFGSRVDIEA